MPDLNTPGVYINEIPSFPPSVAQVETAIPAFIGFTEKAQVTVPDDLINKPVRIGSFKEYEMFFGRGPLMDGAEYYLYEEMRLFYANGGGDCYIVSAGNFGTSPAPGHFMAGLDALLKVDGPSILLFPDAVVLSEGDLASVQKYALAHCAGESRKDRVAILDLKKDDPLGIRFRSNIGNDHLGYGMAYTPWLNIQMPTPAKLTGTRSGSHAVPPSGAIAGVFTMVDSQRGVWKAPANVSLAGIMGPSVTFQKQELDALNIDVTEGKSINAIRSFFGKGTVVWGARTLAGNDNEWRYIPVRRLFIMVEKSVKLAIERFIFEPNDAVTWLKVQAMIENFLTILWRQGALQGAKPEHAFYVAVGLGKTMTQADIDEGRMIAEIGMAAVRPAEFIIIRIFQKMMKN